MVLTLWLALGCIARHEPIRAASPEPISVVPVLARLDSASIADAPERLDAALLAALTERNLQPTLVAPERYVDTFASRRDTSRRLEALDLGGPVLLVETEAAYYSLISGRYRWTVGVRLTLAPDGLTQTFDVPVFLQFQHEREADALAAATPVIARRVGELVDAWIAGRQAP